MANQDTMKVFKSAEFKQMRVAIHGGEPFFCGRDILENLDYTETQIAIITKIFADVPQGMKSRHKLMTPGGVKDLLCLSESGARWFLGRSDKPKSFKLLMWVMADILPMIHNGEAQALFPKLFSAFLSPSHYCCPTLVQHLIFFFS